MKRLNSLIPKVPQGSDFSASWASVKPFRIFAADSELSKLECSMTQVGLKREHAFKNTLPCRWCFVCYHRHQQPQKASI